MPRGHSHRSIFLFCQKPSPYTSLFCLRFTYAHRRAGLHGAAGRHPRGGGDYRPVGRRVFYCERCSADGSSPSLVLVRGAFNLSSSPVHRALVLVLGTNIAVLLDCPKSSRQCSLSYLLTYLCDQVIRENPASRGIDTSAEAFLSVRPGGWCRTPVNSRGTRLTLTLGGGLEGPPPAR